MPLLPSLRSPASALRHPLWWTALAVLLLNDHLLKGAGALPSAVTGKLSDFAGLLVAPVLLAALVRARRSGAILACFAATGAVFAAIKLSPAAARAAESIMAFVSWRIWSDPTDLIALPMLLVGWHVFLARPETASAGSPVLSRAALVLGSFACVATSQVAPPPVPWDPHDVAPQFGQLEILYDAPGGAPTATEVVRVRQLRSGVSVDCTSLLDSPFETITSSLLAPADRFALAPNALLDAASGAGTGGSPGGGQCRVAVIDHDVAGTVTVAYSVSNPGARLSLVRNAAGTLEWALPTVPSTTVLRGAPSIPPTSEACGAATAGLPVTWSTISGTYFQFKGAVTAADGCTDVDLAYNLPGLDDLHWYVCGVDARMLPFVADETVEVTTTFDGFEIRSVDGRASAVFTRTAEAQMRFEVSRTCIVTDSCGERSSPMYPRMSESDWTELADARGAVAAFERGTFGATTRTRLFVLRATEWLAADATCIDGARASGADTQLLRVEETTR